MGIIVGFLLLHHPDKFSGVEEVQVPETVHMHTGDDDIASSGGDISQSTTTIQQDNEDEMYEDEQFSNEENDDNNDEDFEESSDVGIGTEEIIENSTGSSESEDISVEQLVEDIEVSTEASEELKENRLLRNYVQDNGVEGGLLIVPIFTSNNPIACPVLVESGLGLACALVLIHGVRTVG